MNAETPETGPQSGRGATNPGAPVSPDAEPVSSRVSSGGDQVLQAAVRAVLGALKPATDPGDVEPTPSTEFAGYLVELVEREFLAAGWRPPLPEAPDDITDAIEFILVRFVEGPRSRAVIRSVLNETVAQVRAQHDEARQRAASWWEAAKAWCRTARLNHNDHAAVVTAWDKKQADYLSTLAERDEARAKLDQVREVLADPDFRETTHLAAIETSGDEGDCLDTCPGCAVDAIRRIVVGEVQR